MKLTVDAGVLAISLMSMAIRRPFTLQYALEVVDADTAKLPGFMKANYVITGAWTGASPDYGIFKEQFVKVAQPEEEQRAGMLGFQLPVLSNHGRGITSSHSCASEKSAIKTGLVTLVCESEEAYIVSR